MRIFVQGHHDAALNITKHLVGLRGVRVFSIDLFADIYSVVFDVLDAFAQLLVVVCGLVDDCFQVASVFGLDVVEQGLHLGLAVLNNLLPLESA